MPFLVRPDGCHLYFEVHGPRDASTLLLLEGLGGDVPGWRRNIPHLSAGHRVLALDHRGNGRSDPPPAPAGMGLFAEDAVALLDEVGVDRSHLYGQSFGGMVAIEIALERPERVRSLVLAVTHAGSARASRVDATHVPMGGARLALYSEAFARAHPGHVAEDLAVAARTRQRPEAGRRQWRAMQVWDVWDRLGEIDRPVLVLHGTGDRMVAVENARRLAAEIPGARLALLDGAGHVYHSERPDEADAVVLAFLAEVDAAGSPA